MNKAIRWQIYFVECKPDYENPKHYCIDIYDEDDGSWSGITELQAGDQPFVTDEDSSDDFFAPIRCQSGTLQICTKMPNGGMINLDDLLPATNIDHPIRLINLDNSNAVEWQGFLSCEAYNQEYTDIPENISLPVIGVLEAMDSVEVELKGEMAFRKVIAHLAYAMKSIEEQSGMTLFGNVYIADRYKDAIDDKSFYSNVYFTTEEVVNGDNIEVEIHSVSCKEILSRVSKFFGCCWREIGPDLYMHAVKDDFAYYYMPFADIVTNYLTQTSSSGVWTYQANDENNIADLSWRGIGHQRSILQGARRVRVSAKLEEFDINIGLRTCPVNSLVENPSALQAQWGEVYCNTNETFYNLAEHKHYNINLRTYYDAYDSNTFKVATTAGPSPFVPGIGYESTIPWLGSAQAFLAKYQQMIYNKEADSVNYLVTSFMGYLRLREDGDDQETQSGLMVCGIPKYLRTQGTDLQNNIFLDTMAQTDRQFYTFKIDSGLPLLAYDGKIVLDIEIMALLSNQGIAFKDDFVDWGVTGTNLPCIRMAIQIGNKWARYNSSTNTFSFVNYFQTFDIAVDNNGQNTIEVPINDVIIGEASVYVYPVVGGTALTDQRSALCAFVTKIDLSYSPFTELQSDEGSNTYTMDTGKAFRDEISVDLDIATDAKNVKRATMLWEDETTPVKLLSLDGVDIRPEVDLLNRLAEYYGAARQRLELEVAHPTAAPLPLLNLNGINDGKVYLPLSESRDWQTDECKLQCFELPQQPAESQ